MSQECEYESLLHHESLIQTVFFQIGEILEKLNLSVHDLDTLREITLELVQVAETESHMERTSRLAYLIHMRLFKVLNLDLYYDQLFAYLSTLLAETILDRRT